MIVSVVASGPSALECGASHAPGYVIACNDMFIYTRPSAVVSMDGIWCRERVPKYFSRPNSECSVHVRRSAFKYFPDGPAAYPHINVFECDNKSDVMSPDRRTLNGRHTGQCALNLAFTMKPRTVFLYGFDLGRDTGHCHRDYEWKGQGNTNNADKFREWIDGFEVTARFFQAAGIAVYNTNRHSAIRAFKYGRPMT